MIHKLIDAINNIKISYDKKNLHDKLDDPYLENIFEYFELELTYDSLYKYRNAIEYISYNSSVFTNDDTRHLKKDLQTALFGLLDKMWDVYNSKDWISDVEGDTNKELKEIPYIIEKIQNKYIIHLPHSGTEIPDEYIKDYYLDEDELQNNIYQYADYKTDELYEELCDGFDSIVNPYSRLFMDPERFFDDEKESMHVKHSLGWFYENAILEKKPLRSTVHKDKIAKYYHEHHEKLTKLVEEKLELFGECVIIDCHSFSNERYWFHDKDLELPDICIGYDEFHKDDEVIKYIRDAFNKYDDYSISINSPYSGSLVPTKHYHKDKRVKSVMIEINKKLYLEDDNVTPKKRGFRRIAWSSLGSCLKDDLFRWL